MITSKEIINHICINYDEYMINHNTYYDDNLQICSDEVAEKGTGANQLEIGGKIRQAVVKGVRRVHPRGICSLRIADRVSVSSVRSAIMQASRRFKEDVEAKVQPKKNFENIPKFLVL